MKTGKTVIMVFGAVLFAVLLAGFIWSLTRPPVKKGPWPPTQASGR